MEHDTDFGTFGLDTIDEAGRQPGLDAFRRAVVADIALTLDRVTGLEALLDTARPDERQVITDNLAQRFGDLEALLVLADLLGIEP